MTKPLVYVPSAVRSAQPEHVGEATCGGPPRSASSRRDIWNLRAASACSIIGTCLTLSELRKIAKKTRLIDDPHRLPDYDLHGHVVQRTADDNPVARALQKYLDAKFEGPIRKSKMLETESDFAVFWEDAIDTGMVPGAYWACVTHPRLSPAFERRIFGEVHMMSHICGASNRGDARAAAEAQRARAELARRLSGRIAERDERLRLQASEIRELQVAVRAAQAVAAERDRLHAQLAVENGPLRLAQAEAANADLRSETARLERRCRALDLQNESLRLRLAEALQQLRRLETVGRPAENCPGDADRDECVAAPNADLCGSCLLYVGGRPQTVCKLKEWVKDHNGELLHHDGGIEHSPGLLSDLVRRADVVLFPVDCVSHGAAGSVKSLCQRHGKDLCPLRTASVTAFHKAVRGRFKAH